MFSVTTESVFQDLFSNWRKQYVNLPNYSCSLQHNSRQGQENHLKLVLGQLISQWAKSCFSVIICIVSKETKISNA